MTNNELNCNRDDSNVNSHVICSNCYDSTFNEHKISGNCNLCIEHIKSVNKLFTFIENNINIIQKIYDDRQKYIRYKEELELLRTIYNTIITGDSIEINNEIFNYLTDAKYIYQLIDSSTINLYNILYTNEINNYE
tara:strand:+ start:2605 stop:3012 length:408 start_codon:yes stop_codon:yes gene_type:complete